MANVFKAKEIYKKIPSKVNPNKPMVAIKGVYVAGMWRPPYWIDVTLNITQMGGVQAADVVYYTTAEDVGYDKGVLQVLNFTIADPIIETFTNTSDSGVDSDTSTGLLQVLDFTIGDPTILSYGSISDIGYTDGLIKVLDFIVGEITLMTTEYKDGEQSPGQPLLNIKTIDTVTATIT